MFSSESDTETIEVALRVKGVNSDIKFLVLYEGVLRSCPYPPTIRSYQDCEY